MAEPRRHALELPQQDRQVERVLQLLCCRDVLLRRLPYCGR